MADLKQTSASFLHQTNSDMKEVIQENKVVGLSHFSKNLTEVLFPIGASIALVKVVYYSNHVNTLYI